MSQTELDKLDKEQIEFLVKLANAGVSLEELLAIARNLAVNYKETAK